MPTVLRIIDANANRAREALRVMEEAARFILDDPALTEALKQLRHDLTTQLATVDGLEASRDTPGDVGTAISAEREFERESVADVVVAAGKRLSEALRAIEEYGKVVDGTFAAGAEQLRYRGYDLEQRLNGVLSRAKARRWRVCVLISEKLCPQRDWFAVAEAAVAGGCDCIQLREKELAGGELLERAGRLVAMCRPCGVATIVNDRPDVAMLAGADGVHLGQNDLPCADVRKLVGGNLVIGISTGRIDLAERALHDGADYCGIGPMFPTTTKRTPTIVGPEYLREYVQWNKLPHLAIGGVTPRNVGQLIEAGVRGIAVSSVVCAAADPAAVTRRLVEVMQGT